jgi:hypothetical protein
MRHEEQEYTHTPDKLTSEPPVVRDLGSVAEITQGTGGGTIDQIFGGQGGFGS